MAWACGDKLYGGPMPGLAMMIRSTLVTPAGARRLKGSGEGGANATKRKRPGRADPRSTSRHDGAGAFIPLVAATTAYGLIPIIVPELKTITIGGAVSGCSIESMSFRYGGFHDTCVEYEIITAAGDVLVCTPDNNFYSENDFWQIWNRDNYAKAKAIGDPNNIFRDLYTKTCVAAQGARI